MVTAPNTPVTYEPRRSSKPIAESIQIARLSTKAKLAMYGSLDKWPTLSLLPNQYPACICGWNRVSHRFVGTDLMGCRKSGCKVFQAARVVGRSVRS